MESETIHIRLPVSLIEALKAQAEKETRSVSNMVRVYIAQGLMVDRKTDRDLTEAEK